MIKLNASQLRTYKKDPTSSSQTRLPTSPVNMTGFDGTGRGASKKDKIKRNPIYIILDNVLDTYNIGSIFRLADAVAAEEVIITGQAEVPPNTRIKKASINTTEWVKWQYVTTAREAIERVRREIREIRVIGVEQDERSVPYTEMTWGFPVAIVVGNETNGISREVLDMCDSIIELPMFGVNRSLNVMVSLGIVLYEMLEGACPELAEG